MQSSELYFSPNAKSHQLASVFGWRVCLDGCEQGREVSLEDACTAVHTCMSKDVVVVGVVLVEAVAAGGAGSSTARAADGWGGRDTWVGLTLETGSRWKRMFTLAVRGTWVGADGRLWEGFASCKKQKFLFKNIALAVI